MATVVEEHISQNPKEMGVWSTILQQVLCTDARKLPSNKSLLVLGDDETGKTTLIANLANIEKPKKGSALEYHFIEVRDEYREESTRLGAWILDGDLKHTELLNFALTDANFEDSCCLLVVSMSEPWKIIKSLETWTDVLEQHIESLNLKPAKLKQCRHRILFKFLNYISSTDEAESKLVGTSNHITYDGFDEGTLKIGEDTSGSPNSLGRTTLSRNLGVDIIVVVTKTDLISKLEKDYDYTEETFDFIQQAIRKFCLKIGASLFYVSSYPNKNCDLLHKYLAHRIYDLPFKAVPSVVERDAIFVPAGWDNEKKISILYDNIRSIDPDDDYNNFITERSASGPTQRDAEFEVESDQEFLLRMQNDMGKQVSAPLPSAPSPVQPRQNLANSIDTQPSGEGVLQNFFNSLLSKGRTMPPNSGHQDQ